MVRLPSDYWQISPTSVCGRYPLSAPIPLDEQARLEALHRICILDTPPEDAYDDLTRLAAVICNVPIATITLVDEDRQWFKAKVGVESRETPRSVSFCAHAILGNELFEVADAQQDERFRANPLVTGDPRIRFYAGMPIKGPSGHNLGTLCVIDRKPRQLTEADRVALRVLARQAAAHILIHQQVGELQEASRRQAQIELKLRESQDHLRDSNRRLQELVRTDALTGLGNRRLFEERLRQSWKLAGRLNVPLSILMLDIDHFKGINDRYGHAAGDDVLRRLGMALERSIRESDICARYGGEEFAVLLPATTLPDAIALADQLRVNIANTECGGISVTVSIGVACDEAVSAGADASNLVSRADTALYAAKAAGRNRVQSA